VNDRLDEARTTDDPAVIVTEARSQLTEAPNDRARRPDVPDVPSGKSALDQHASVSALPFVAAHFWSTMFLQS
jgi:hypothetical protein